MEDNLENSIQSKQVVYIKFVPRMITALLDAYILGLITLYPLRLISNKLFIYFFRDKIIEFNVDINDALAINKLQYSYEFLESIPAHLGIKVLLISFLINLLITACYFVFFWHKFGTTPVRYLFGIKVVNEKTMQNLSIADSIKRMFGLIFVMVGCWSIFFTKKRQALHDKIARSIVIKK